MQGGTFRSLPWEGCPSKERGCRQRKLCRQRQACGGCRVCLGRAAKFLAGREQRAWWESIRLGLQEGRMTDLTWHAKPTALSYKVKQVFIMMKQLR